MIDTSMLDLFKMEVEQQGSLLNSSLLALEDTPASAEHLEAAMRGAHSIKGAARMIGLETVQRLAHVMEDCMVAAQEGRLVLTAEHIDTLLKGMDMIVDISADEDIEHWETRNGDALEQLLALLSQVLDDDESVQAPTPPEPPRQEPVTVSAPSLVDASMLDLFRMECEQHGKTLNDILLALEQTPGSTENLEELMRAAHSIKGAARLIGLPPVVDLTHVLEDNFVAAQEGRLNLSSQDIDIMLQAADIINAMKDSEDIEAYLAQQTARIAELVEQLAAISPAGGESPAEPVQKTRDVAAFDSGVAQDVSPQDLSMYELFRVECEQHGRGMADGLLAMEQDPTATDALEPLMRAAHSIKGAARLAGVDLIVKLAHVMEDSFVAAQQGEICLAVEQVDVLLEGLDMIQELAAYGQNLDQWEAENKHRYDVLLANLKGILTGAPVTPVQQPASRPSAPAEAPQKTVAPAASEPPQENQPTPQKDRVLRVSAEQINRLMGLAGESLVESRWLHPYSESLRRLKRRQTRLVCMIDDLREYMERGPVDDELRGILRGVQKQASSCREIMSDRLTELESFDRRSSNLSSRLHREVVESRMRPFSDGVHGFPRMVRDISRSLNKSVQLVIEGESTLVDRDILDKIESPLNHLIRNAIDHGMETPEERALTDKPEKGVIRLGAYHHAGMLSIVVKDDGRGVDLEKLRQKVVDKGLVDASMAKTLSDSELMEFLFLPSFSTKEKVSEISGRGVGLDVVHDVVQEMRGTVKATSTLGQGTKFHLQLPLTLSVIPALIVDIANEPYAFPLARIDRIVRVTSDMVQEAEGNQFITLDGKHVGLVVASQILEKDAEPGLGKEFSIVVLNERNNYYGMVVDRYLGERELVVQVMPEALGKVQDISAAALMEDGSPVLIVDIDDLIRSIEKVLKVARLGKVSALEEETYRKYKRVLVVDDSITVREVERKLLASAGYEVETAVDGADGLNMLRSQSFDMLVTDVDMPRMNGIELVQTVRQDVGLRTLPILMVSYKDREEDRVRGLDAGADYYLTKGSFHDETLLQAVIDLIGEAEA